MSSTPAQSVRTPTQTMGVKGSANNQTATNSTNKGATPRISG